MTVNGRSEEKIYEKVVNSFMLHRIVNEWLHLSNFFTIIGKNNCPKIIEKLQKRFKHIQGRHIMYGKEIKLTHIAIVTRRIESHCNCNEREMTIKYDFIRNNKRS